MAHSDLHQVPLRERPPAPLKLAKTLAVLVWFHLACFMINGLQFLVYPLRFALRPGEQAYQRLIDYTKKAFGLLLVSLSQLFAPTKLVLTFTDAQGNLLDAEQFVRRDGETGPVQELLLPSHSIWMANHQIYLDWIYLWCAAYYANLSAYLFIILKASLKWIPVVGWGMQFFHFIFLKRNWQHDRLPLARQLSQMAKALRQGSAQTETDRTDKKTDEIIPSSTTAGAPTTTTTTTSSSSSSSNSSNSSSSHNSQALGRKLLLLIFPEGTLVSPDTRPVSAKFAAKLNIPDLKNLLLPRSTGLFFCLRSLAAAVDDLHLVDYTIGYPGIPPHGYGQEFYTLRSVFVLAIPPPEVHINCIVTRITSPVDSLDPKTLSATGKKGLRTTASELSELEGAVSGTSGGEKALSDPVLADPPPLGKLPPSAQASGTEQWEASPSEREAFDTWLRHRWTVKDRMMDQFYTHGDFVGGAYVEKRPGRGGAVELPVRLLHTREVLDVFAWFLPAFATGLVAVGVWYYGRWQSP